MFALWSLLTAVCWIEGWAFVIRSCVVTTDLALNFCYLSLTKPTMVFVQIQGRAALQLARQNHLRLTLTCQIPNLRHLREPQDATKSLPIWWASPLSLAWRVSLLSQSYCRFFTLDGSGEPVRTSNVSKSAVKKFEDFSAESGCWTSLWYLRFEFTGALWAAQRTSVC